MHQNEHTKNQMDVIFLCISIYFIPRYLKTFSFLHYHHHHHPPIFTPFTVSLCPSPCFNFLISAVIHSNKSITVHTHTHLYFNFKFLSLNVCVAQQQHHNNIFMNVRYLSHKFISLVQV